MGKNKDERTTLRNALTGEYGAFKLYVCALVYGPKSKLMVSREIVLIDPFNRNVSISGFLKKLDSLLPGHGITKRRVIEAQVLVQQPTLIATGWSSEYITLTIVGVPCKALDLIQGNEPIGKYLRDTGEVRSSLGKYAMPDYLWWIYNSAFSALL